MYRSIVSQRYLSNAAQHVAPEAAAETLLPVPKLAVFRRLELPRRATQKRKPKTYLG
jgi:hypothetical protein